MKIKPFWISIFVVITFLGHENILIAQIDSCITNTRVVIRDGFINARILLFVVRLGESTLQIDSTSLKLLNPDWIKKIDVLKNVYQDEILITIKRRYIQKATRKLILQSYCLNKSDTLFKVTRIILKGDYYIINARRNDSLFKIISKKESFPNPNLDLLNRGSYYYFDFNNSDKNTNKEKVVTLSSNINYLDVKKTNYFIIGGTKIKFTKRFHNRLYFTKNLKGIYYVPKPAPRE